MTDEPGVYQLHLYLPKTARVRIGKLGVFVFPAGRYIYTGSALSGLGRRLARHERQNKTLHWHIDYLLRYACIERISTVPTRLRLECALNDRTLGQPGARVIVNGFGSSDCRCPTHLVYVGYNWAVETAIPLKLWRVPPCPALNRRSTGNEPR